MKIKSKIIFMTSALVLISNFAWSQETTNVNSDCYVIAKEIIGVGGITKEIIGTGGIAKEIIGTGGITEVIVGTGGIATYCTNEGG